MTTKNSPFSVLNLNTFQKKCFHDYAKHADNSLKSNPKKFWQFMNNSRSNQKDVPKVVYLNVISSSNEHESAEMFSSVYSSKAIPCDFESPDIYSFDQQRFFKRR